ncbi:MAG: radical SAM protein [Elusimicrobiales bacterium]|nr:radical SAM protein [Elusimicrobiales bacterium]
MSYNLISCVWELTRKCNLKCIHCGSSAGCVREGELNCEESLKLCHDLKKTGCVSVALMGGEPFLSPNFKIIAQEIRKLNMELSIITNGTILEDDLLYFLKSLSPKAIATSIDGIDETHDFIRGVKGAFEKTLKFIDRCIELGLPVSVITSVSKINLSQIKDIASLIMNKNIAWQIQIVGSEGKRFPKEYLLDEDDFYAVGSLLELLRRKYPIKTLPFIAAHDLGYYSCFIRNIWLYDEWCGCQAGISVCGIRSNGEVLGCLSINDDRFVEGDVRGKSLYDIWNDKDSFSYTRKYKLSDAGPNCYGCRYFKKCGGGCSEMSLMKTGVLHNDPYCFYRYEKNNLSIFEKLNLKLNQILWRKIDKKRLIEIFDGDRL